MDENGVDEIIWIETPHIGGILKVANFCNGRLEVVYQQNGYSNHAIGERNLCLTSFSHNGDTVLLHCPSQNRKKIASFSWDGQSLIQQSTYDFTVDFSVPLHEQLAFEGQIPDAVNCINL